MASPSETPPPSAPRARDVRERTPEEIRRYESQVWDLAKHLVHPAALYVVAQISLWCALEANAAFRSPLLGFWTRSGIHVFQFLGAWAVFYGTLLRDMRQPIRTPTLLLWFAVLGAAVAWLRPERASPESSAFLRCWLGAQLLAGVVAWAATVATWRRRKREHEAAAPESKA